MLSCLSVTGAPPFGVFVGEFMILSQAIQLGNFPLAVLLAVAYMYAFIGLNRQSIRMVFGQLDTSQTLPHSSVDNQRENWISIIIPSVNLVISLLIGIYMLPAILQAAAGLGL